MKLLFSLFIVIALQPTALAQRLAQKVYGTVVDRDSRKPLAGVTVSVVEVAQNISSQSDSTGHFLLPNVAVGRIKVQATGIGYHDYVSDYLILSATKEVDLSIQLEEKTKLEEGVIVSAVRNPKLPVNKYSLVSGRSFTPEETQRYAASVNDPSRMALAFPGVQATRDTRSDIVIRGNNPVGMQWRLEGVDIVNPNHFARKGSSGGGITIFSLSMLDNSDFLTGAMPAEYGDVLSGVFDMHFRKGNNKKAEHTIKAGMIGLDFSTEGPIKKNQSSYLVNYRYSTLGLLQAIGLNLVGERETNTFQDLSFNLASSNKNNSVQWNLWGIGGYSKETYKAEEKEWKQYDDYAIYDFRTKMGAAGIGNTVQLTQKSFIQSSLVLMAQRITYVDDTLTKQMTPSKVNEELYDNKRLSFTSSYNHKFSASANIKTGVYVSQLFYQFKRDRLDFSTKQYGNIIDGDGNTLLVQPYWQLSLKPGAKWTINPGMHLMHLRLNNKTTIDPRLSVQYKFNNRQSLTAAYGLHSKLVPLGYYFYKNAAALYPNHDLDMMRAHHYILAFDQLMGKGWRLHTEGYYQSLFKIPIVNDGAKTFWILNELDGYAQEALVSEGKGTNKGIDFSIEKFFSKGLFFIGAFSVFNSTYEALNAKTYNTRFNSGTNGSFTGAKEWSWKNNTVFQFGWKMIYNGGLRLTPLSDVISDTREPVLDETKPYTEKVSSYFRTDTRFALRKNKTRRSWQLALDIQNVFGLTNTDGLSRKYDPSVNKWIYKEQSGIVPVLSYQLDF